MVEIAAVGHGAGGREGVGRKHPQPAADGGGRGREPVRRARCGAAHPRHRRAERADAVGERRLRHPAVRQRHPARAGSGRPIGLRGRIGAAAAGAARPGRELHQRRAGARSRQERQDDEVAGRRATGPADPRRRRSRSNRRCSRSPTSHRSNRPTSRPRKSRRKSRREGEEGSGTPSLPDLEALVDAAADDLNAKVKEHYDRKPSRPQRQQQAMYSGGGMQVRGSGASGKSDDSPRASSPL